MRKGILFFGPAVILGAITWRTYFTDYPQRSASSRIQIAERLFHEGSMKEAIGELEAAVREDPYLVEARESLGSLYQMVNRRVDEVRVYEEGVRLMPREARLHYALGMAQYVLKRYDVCAVEMQKCLEIGPYDPQYTHLLGMSFERAGRLPEALAFWRQAARDHADDPIIVRGLMRTERKLKVPASAGISPAGSRAVVSNDP